MRHIAIAVLTVLLAIGISASAALAAITFHSGPTVTFSGLTATANANMSGLGNTPAFAQLTVNGVANFTCTSPGGGSTAPGQNPAAASGASPQVNLGNSNHNGRGTISNLTATLQSPPTPSAATECPNSNWIVTQSSLTVTSATLVITQGGATIFSQTFPAP